MLIFLSNGSEPDPDRRFLDADPQKLYGFVRPQQWILCRYTCIAGFQGQSKAHPGSLEVLRKLVHHGRLQKTQHKFRGSVMIKINNFNPRPLWRAFKLQEKPPVLQIEHPALQISNFSLQVTFSFPDREPDPQTLLNPDLIRTLHCPILSTALSKGCWNCSFSHKNFFGTWRSEYH